MTLTPYDRAIKRTARVSVVWGVVALLAAVGFFGVAAGVEYARVKPEIVALSIVDGTTQPAGGAFTVSETTLLPPDCIPRTRRWVEFNKKPGQSRPDLQLLPDEAMPDYGPQVIPIPLSATPRCGRFFEQKTTQGCGFLNGILTPLSTTSAPVDVCIAPSRLVLSKVAP